MELVDEYLAELTPRTREILGEELLAVYTGGSYALGAYEQGRSDIDVTVVVGSPLDTATKDALVAALRHEALPCPARGLELVVYPLAVVQQSTGAPGFELNLNTGARMDFRADHEPGEIEDFWFAIDRSIVREHGRPLHGPPTDSVFAEIPRETLAPQLVESMRWHRGDDSTDARLNNVRSQNFLDTGHWISKPEARQRLDDAQGAP